MSVLITESRNDVALLRLNRPERLNALNRDLLRAIDESCGQLEKDTTVRAVVITGGGDRAFCAGADINELDGISSGDALRLMRLGQRIFDRLAALPQPVIAAVNGPALGGGCELALACDIRFAGARARFGQPEIKLANLPGWGGTQRLPRVIGPARATHMILSGEPVDAETAMQWGLATRVCDDAALLEESLSFAHTLASHARIALAGAKHAIAFGLEHGVASGLLAEAEAVAACCATPEQNDAVRAFLTRRSERRQATNDYANGGLRTSPAIRATRDEE